MRSTLLAAGTAVALVVCLTTRVPAHDEKAAMRAAVHRPDAVKWLDGPPSLPPGAKFAVLEGDPSKPGSFVFRVKVPDGYRIPPHTHPKPERVTIISGTFHLGMGDKVDLTKGEALPAGTYLYSAGSLTIRKLSHREGYRDSAYGWSVNPRCTANGVLLSVAASVKRHALDPWAYLKHLLNELPARPAGADFADLLPDRPVHRPAAG